jgi:hypothetical protein
LELWWSQTMRGTTEEWAALWSTADVGPRPATAPPLLVEVFEVPCERDACRGVAGFKRCSAWYQRCGVCDRVTMRPEEEFGKDC